MYGYVIKCNIYLPSYVSLVILIVGTVLVDDMMILYLRLEVELNCHSVWGSA